MIHIPLLSFLRGFLLSAFGDGHHAATIQTNTRAPGGSAPRSCATAAAKSVNGPARSANNSGYRFLIARHRVWDHSNGETISSDACSWHHFVSLGLAPVQVDRKSVV